jgi:hypothetical protein
LRYSPDSPGVWKNILSWADRSVDSPGQAWLGWGLVAWGYLGSRAGLSWQWSEWRIPNNSPLVLVSRSWLIPDAQFFAPCSLMFFIQMFVEILLWEGPVWVQKESCHLCCGDPWHYSWQGQNCTRMKNHPECGGVEGRTEAEKSMDGMQWSIHPTELGSSTPH